RWILSSDSDFMRFASDFARVFPVAVPVHYEQGRRRLIKFSYTQHLIYPESRVARRIKRWSAPTLARRWNRVEDWFEALPQHQTAEDWTVPARHEAASAPGLGE